MTAQDKQDHEEKALARLPNQFIDSTNLRNLISANAGRFQGLNDELIKLLDFRAVSTSTGKQLDNIATILDMERSSGESDISFRSRLISETAVLSKSGEVEHIIEVYTLLTEAATIFYSEIYPAGFQITAHVASDAEDPDVDAAIISAMANVRSGGIDMVLVLSTETDYFMFDSSVNVDGSGNGTSSAEHGFGSSADVDGGQLSRVLV